MTDRIVRIPTYLDGSQSISKELAVLFLESSRRLEDTDSDPGYCKLWSYFGAGVGTPFLPETALENLYQSTKSSALITTAPNSLSIFT